MNDSKYLNQKYKNEISSVSESCPEVSTDTITEFYTRQCEKFEELFRDDAPLSAVRNSAWSQTEKALRDDKLPDADISLKH